MMAMKFFDRFLRLTRELEFDIWREANLVESYGTSKEGLALAAARRGVSVFTMGKVLSRSYVDAIAKYLPGLDSTVLELLYDHTRTKFRAMRILNVPRRISLAHMKTLLQRSQIPLLLTTTSLFGEKEDLPHWIVLTGYSSDEWCVNNPLGDSPDMRIGEPKLSKAVGFQGVQCAVVIRGLKHAHL